MKRDHNIYVSRVRFFCSIFFFLILKYFMQCIIVGTLYMLLLFYMIKFMGYRNFQSYLCTLKILDFL